MAIAFVKKSALFSSDGPDTSSVVASTAYTGGSDHILVMLWTGYSAGYVAGNTSVSGGAGNSWVRASPSYTNAGNSTVEIFYCMGAAAGSYAVTMNHSSQNFRRAQVLEFSGMASASAYDTYTTGTAAYTEYRDHVESGASKRTWSCLLQ